MKVNSELSFHYHLRREQNKKSNGLVPIYCRISLNGRRRNFSTRLFVPQEMWSKDVEQVKVKYPEADRINKELMLIGSKISKAYQNAFQQNRAVSLDDFKYLVFNEDKAVKAVKASNSSSGYSLNVTLEDGTVHQGSLDDFKNIGTGIPVPLHK